MPAESPPRRGPGHALRKTFYGVFYRLPGRWRRRLVRLLKQRYTVGAVTLVRTDGTAAGGTAADTGVDGAAVGTGDRLLLLRQPPGEGWSLPAGLMNRGERPIECAVRELAEETGIRLRPDDLEPAVPNVLVHAAGWIDCVFHARVPPDTPIMVDGAEVYDAAFHPLDALPPLTVPTARLLGHYGIGPYAGYPETRSA
jgi:ADP-ribose pyrophosphatase YjhB (NUDIX family)